MDNSFKDTDIAKFQKYASAFFPGAQLGVIKKPDFFTKA